VYKVFVVDDEIVVREGIRDEVKWKEKGFEFVGEAPDGELALMQIKELKPDILITDIKMPFMDGLELSKIVRENMPWIKIIILSGHNEFEYAKEAISLGVAEYLLKPVSAKDLIFTLMKVKSCIEEEKRERENVERMKNQLANNMPVIKNRFLSDFVQGLIPLDTANEKFSALNVDIENEYYLTTVIEKCFLSNYNSETDLKINTLVSEILENGNSALYFKKSEFETISIYKSDDKNLIEDMAFSYSQSIKYEVERNTNSKITIGVGDVHSNMEGIITSYNEAVSALKYKYAIGSSKIIGFKDVKENNRNKKVNGFEKIRKINIMEFLKFGAMNDIDRFLDKYTEQLNVQNKNFLIYSYHFLIDIALTISNFIDELEGDYEKIIPEITKMEEVISEVDSIDKFRTCAKTIIFKAFQFRDGKIKNKYGTIIDMAKKFINVKYLDQEISLNMVSSHVNVSPSHFSTIFSQETGETFIEYLTKTRIRKAKELLKTTNQRSSEVAYNVGYNDPRYFTYLFKKFTKKTPIEYRNTGVYITSEN
jgi:two-component system response regulator YesN